MFFFNQRNLKKSCPNFLYGNLNSTPTSLQVMPTFWSTVSPNLKDSFLETKKMTHLELVQVQKSSDYKKLRLVGYPMIYTGFWPHPNVCVGGWPWDFWTIHSFTMVAFFFLTSIVFAEKVSPAKHLANLLEHVDCHLVFFCLFGVGFLCFGGVC